MKIIVAPDSFKGNQTSLAVANAIERGIRKFDPSFEVIKVPMADGGEGTVEAAASAAGGRIIKAVVTGPLNEIVEAEYAILHDGTTAVIEMASASGLPLVPVHLKNPGKTSTIGTGELIRHALDLGCKKIILGIGGSATNDGGMGAASALGVKFLDDNGEETGVTGDDMLRVTNIDISSLDPRILNTDILAACDVSNPFYGPSGAAYIYGPQKGATEEQVISLDNGLRNLAAVIEKALGITIADIPGTGAAGGLGGGLIAFFHARLQSGIELILEAVEFEKILKNAQLVITGEGKTDYQTAFGKVPAGVAAAAKKQGIPVVCFSGALGKKIEELYPVGITALFSTANREMTLDYAIDNSLLLLEEGAENIIRLFCAGKSM
ncbi:MAG: glycerate kinase [Bacteroidetes bacterium]|nr:glycerate kinase [Bacteroidota bacterium]